MNTNLAKPSETKLAIPSETKHAIFLVDPCQMTLVSSFGSLSLMFHCNVALLDNRTQCTHTITTVQHTTTTVTPALGDMALTTTTVYNAQGHSHNCLYITTQQYTTALLTTCTYKQ